MNTVNGTTRVFIVTVIVGSRRALRRGSWSDPDSAMATSSRFAFFLFCLSPLYSTALSDLVISRFDRRVSRSVSVALLLADRWLTRIIFPRIRSLDYIQVECDALVTDLASGSAHQESENLPPPLRPPPLLLQEIDLENHSESIATSQEDNTGRLEAGEMEVDDILDQSSSIQQTDDKGRNILDDVYNFKNFDVAKNPLDHHYLGGLSDARNWIKKIQQEWNILATNLPDAIFSVYYHSGGYRIYPNLFVDGNGLVLNDKPYFNAAGYHKKIQTIEDEKNAILYNENTYLLNLKTMLYLL
ncbi:hypothetical protein ZIOFF_068542 [Zingiber officinale]|uniref:Uncharacterized protein n=1 Tax=Zingiber officinale TaxID=94328 RepID=A0A8J5EEQ5_ZINOF|nr:hypothetical protein ZIOFF_068542 [Zingiber officinale]